MFVFPSAAVLETALRAEGGDMDSMKWSFGKALKWEHPSGHSRMRLLLMGWGFGIRDSP